MGVKGIGSGQSRVKGGQRPGWQACLWPEARWPEAGQPLARRPESREPKAPSLRVLCSEDEHGWWDGVKKLQTD